MTALPSSVSFTDSGITEAQFKTAIANQREFLAGLLGTDGEKSTALQTLGSLGNDTVTKSANYTIAATDRGLVFLCSGTFTLSLTAAATLADGFAFAVINTGSGIVTIDPSSTEQIDGANTKDIAAGSWAIVSCTGTAFYSMGSSVGYSGKKIEIFSTSGNWVVPTGISSCIVFVYGGGGAGSGNFSNTSYGGHGGCGIGFINGLTPGLSILITIGAGGVAGGGSGGASSFGAYITATGGVGAPSSAANGIDGTSSYSIPNGIQLGNTLVGNYPDFYKRYTSSKRPNGTGNGAVAWAINSAYPPGAPGVSGNPASLAAGGVGGGIFIIY